MLPDGNAATNNEYPVLRTFLDRGDELRFVIAAMLDRSSDRAHPRQQGRQKDGIAFVDLALLNFAAGRNDFIPSGENGGLNRAADRNPVKTLRGQQRQRDRPNSVPFAQNLLPFSEVTRAPANEITRSDRFLDGDLLALARHILLHDHCIRPRRNWSAGKDSDRFPA